MSMYKQVAPARGQIETEKMEKMDANFSHDGVGDDTHDSGTPPYQERYESKCEEGFTPVVSEHRRTNVIRQSAYFLSLCPLDVLQKYNPVKLDDANIWFVRHERPPVFPSHQHCSYESVALLGIALDTIPLMYDEDNFLLTIIKSHPSFEDIQGIDSLTNAAADVLRKFQNYFEDITDKSLLLLFNIEPRGEGRYCKIYPSPRCTLPGGTMEEADSNDYEQCALREFMEETHIDIRNQYMIIATRKICKDVGKPKRCFGSSYSQTYQVPTRKQSIPFDDLPEWKKQALLKQKQTTEPDETSYVHPYQYVHRAKPRRSRSKIICMYFLIRIKSASST